MKFYLFLGLGILSVANVVYKLAVCPSCDADFLSIPISGYTELAIQSIFSVVFLNSAYREHKKQKTVG